MMYHRCSRRLAGIKHLNLLHHAPVFMIEKVTVQDERSREIDEPAANFYPAIRSWRAVAFRVLAIRALAMIVRSGNRYCVAPDIRLLHNNVLRRRGVVGIEDFQHLKW